MFDPNNHAPYDELRKAVRAIPPEHLPAWYRSQLAFEALCETIEAASNAIVAAAVAAFNETGAFISKNFGISWEQIDHE